MTACKPEKQSDCNTISLFALDFFWVKRLIAAEFPIHLAYEFVSFIIIIIRFPATPLNNLGQELFKNLIIPVPSIFDILDKYQILTWQSQNAIHCQIRLSIHQCGKSSIHIQFSPFFWLLLNTNLYFVKMEEAKKKKKTKLNV